MDKIEITADPFPPLETARLRLRCVAFGDAVEIAKMMTPEVSRWLAYWPYPFTLEMAIERIELLRNRACAGSALPFAVTEKDNGNLIGMAMFQRDKEIGRRGSFGYWLAEKYQGKGYMKELAPVVLAKAFELFDVDVIEAAAQPTNAASFAVMLSCGMKPSKTGFVYAPARNRDELCHFFEISRSNNVRPR